MGPINHTAGISLALLLGAATASAQPAAAPQAQPAPPIESVTVEGVISEAVNHFVEAAATPTREIGKVARWEVPVCPYALGMPAATTARVVQRVKEVAVQAGVRVSSDAACNPNILIAFTSTPQALLDNIRKEHADWLGYHERPQDLDRLGTMTRSIQAWYSTGTIDLQGRHQSDGPDEHGFGLQITAPCYVVGGTTRTAGPNPWCTTRLADAKGRVVEASRVVDGLRATLDHVTIIANPPAVHAGMPAIEDYIALLALAQINSLDKCQALLSITNLLASGCTQIAAAITANDLGYLKGVYGANPEVLPGLQQSEIARRMEQGIAGR
jgi:hypothetical protein